MSRSYFAMTHEQHLYGWRVKRGVIETFDLSWPCLNLACDPVVDHWPDEDNSQSEKDTSEFDFDAHREVIAIFKRMGVR